MATCIRAACLAACLASAAASDLLPPHVHFYCPANDTALSDSFRAQFSLWNDALGGRFTLDPVSEPGEAEIIVQRGPTAPMAGLEWGTDTRWIQVSDTLPLNDTVVLHEVGHALGLDHSEDSADIMFPYISGKRAELSPNDVNRVRAVYGLPAVDFSSFDIRVSGAGKTRVFHCPYNVRWDAGDGTAPQYGTAVKHRYATRGWFNVIAYYYGVQRNKTFRR